MEEMMKGELISGMRPPLESIMTPR